MLAITGVLYTIPSLALFAMPRSLDGVAPHHRAHPARPYTLLILSRNTVTGLDGVPVE